MRKIAQAHGASVAQVALAWLLAKKPVSAVILGASKIKQLEDNLGAVDVTLTAAELSELDAATSPAPVYPNWFTEKISADRPLVEALSRP
jgi:aryl-alcohol dehydrogenase-like predicted oxidoreductase